MNVLYCQYLNSPTNRPIWSSDVSLWRSRCWLQWGGGICMISWPLTPRLCVGGNLGFLHPVRISQAFLSAQESGSAADTTLSFALHVSLCLSFESLRTSVIILLIFCLSSSVNHFCQFVHLSGLWHSRRFNCITYHSQRSGFGWFLRVHLCSWADLHCWILLFFFLCGDVKSNVVTGKSSFRLAQMVRHTYWHK